MLRPAELPYTDVEFAAAVQLAASQDHPATQCIVVDGRGAVTFLKRIKECLEDPTRILIEI